MGKIEADKVMKISSKPEYIFFWKTRPTMRGTVDSCCLSQGRRSKMLTDRKAVWYNIRKKEKS